MMSKYFDYPDADLVLRSSGPDNIVEFRVHRCILAAASPFFRHMFALPQDPFTSKQIPAVDVSESNTVLEMLLQFVYPIPDPPIATLDELTPVLAVAMKYDMTPAIASLRRLLMQPAFLEADPTRVYAIAARFDLEEEARLASAHTLRVNVLELAPSDELRHISAYAYHKLLALHRTRAAAAQALLVLPEDVKCMSCNGYTTFAVPRWWKDFEARAREELGARPMSEVVCSLGFLARAAQTGCERCAGSILDAHWWLERLRKGIDDLPSTI
ncbi:hypothetical protein OBBRIDRAFT_125880 [Obba rivulosa]|uniref:BTB domain-containing protein n=1 Tax=Obba rivulosa TaxID=1052685 RepID=A0A8E2J4R3_9APHY|nr:hypothetical protein OBBRIDRAFT_125880 [Obba rivulosa]